MGKFSKRVKNIKVGTWILLVALAVGLFFGVRYLTQRNSSKAAQYQTVPAEKGDLTATIGATGTVRSFQTSMLNWQTTGIIGSVNVKPGDHVQAGDILASLEKTSLPQTVILAQADLVAAQQNLADLNNSKTSMAQAELSLVNAQKNYDNAKATLDNFRAVNKGATSEAVQNAQAQVVLAQSRLNGAKTYFDYVKNLGKDDPNYAQAYTALYSAQKALETAQNTLNYYLLVPSGRDIAEATAKADLAKAQLDDAQREWDRVKNGPTANDVASAQARVDAAQATINMSQVSSPFAGTVTEVNGLVGDQVSPGSNAFRVDDLSHMQVDVQVSEVDINSVQLDQPVSLTFDAITGATYNGKVVEVAQAGDTVQGAVSFTVTVELTNADANVKPGMTAGVNITVKQLKNVLLVPNRAVRLIDNQRVVYILVNGQAQEVKIDIGASSDTNSEVISGDLKLGDPIILNPPSNLFNPQNSGGGPFGGGL